MKANIASILKNEGASMKISGTVEIGSFDFMGSSITFTSPVKAEGTILNIGGTIEISVLLTGEYATQCSRCGKNISQEFSSTLFESVEENDFSDADPECLSLSGSTLDFTGAIEACIFNNIPLKFLCSEECKGLCPVCGINLNENECNCDTRVYDPRFAIFRKLEQRGVENGSSEEKNF